MTAPLIFDCETELVRPGCQAPPLACIAFSYRQEHWLRHWTDIADVERALLDPAVLLVGHNVAFDMAVIAEADPGLWPAIFTAYEQDRVTDTEIREKLLDIAKGRYRGFEEEEVEPGQQEPRLRKIKYSLEDCADRRLRRKLDKDTWRLRYGELRHLPLEQWPAGARTYPLEDVRATEDLFLLQEQDNRSFVQQLPHVFLTEKETKTGVFADQFRQARAGFWIKLMTNWGIHTSASGVHELARRTKQEYEQIASDLRGDHQYELGSCRRCGTGYRAKPMHPLLQEQWERQQLCPNGLQPPLLKRDRTVQRRSGSVEVIRGARDTKAARAKVVQAYTALHEEVPLTDSGQVALDARTCSESQDPVLCKYGEFGSLSKVLSTDIKFLLDGVHTPLHSHFEVCQETGRTGSSKPNIQNLKRRGGLRECFVPRPGYLFAACDYSGAELCTLGQVCLHLFGQSALADAMNAGKDPHLLVASQILGLPYDDLKKRHEHGAGSDCLSSRGACSCPYCIIDNARQTGKILNFGGPGGLGPKALVEFARTVYDVFLTEADAKRLKGIWFAALPEMKHYFKYIDETIRHNRPIVQLGSKRYRGDKKYTARCNTLFQGLAADMAKDAGWRICRGCYLEVEGPLFGCRMVNFIHDEFIVEVPEHWGHEAAQEIAKHMIEAARVWLPDVKIAAKPLLMRQWSKKAKPVWRDGRLVPWN